MTYVRRQITLTFQLGQGTFKNSGGANKLQITGLRCYVTVSQAQTPTPSRCMIRVFGLTLDQINTLTKAGLSFAAPNNPNTNFVAVQAGDYGQALATVYNGTIYEAYPDFSDDENAAFVIIANAANVIQLQPQTPVTFPGSVDVVQALTQILQPIGYTVQNNGVSVSLASPYFPGTAWQQAMRCIEHANIFGYFDHVAKILYICPKTGSRSGGVYTVSKATGMIGYPEFMQNRIRIRTLFDPTFKGVLTPIKVESILSAANGMWVSNQVDYNLASEDPSGPWEMVILAAPVGAP